MYKISQTFIFHHYFFVSQILFTFAASNIKELSYDPDCIEH